MIPKSNNVWVFGSWYGKSYSDNSKYMYKYVSSINGNIVPIWITKDKSQVSKLRLEGVNCFYYKSIKGICYQLRSKVAFVGHSIPSDLNSYCISLNTVRVQLWHGMPLKKIGFDDAIYTSSNLFVRKFPTLFSFLTNNRFDLVMSCGEVCSKLFSSAFNISADKIYITGFPRNDVFFPSVLESQKCYKIIYMPTFRGDSGDDFDLFERFNFKFDIFDKFFEDESIELTIRTHPANKPSENILQKIELSKNIFISNVDDVYNEINRYDCLITDYSSIMFDFSISNKDILFAPFDIEEYVRNDREFYFDYSDICDGLYCKDWDELLCSILKVKRGERKSDLTFIKSFNDFEVCTQNEYSERVFCCVNDYLNR